MLEDSSIVMEKKSTARQTSNSTKSAGTFDRKPDPNSVGKNGRQNRRRDHGNGRVSQPSQPDFSNRKPVPQKTRSALDKRPRQRSGVSDRQREAVAQKGTWESRSLQNQRLSQNGNHLLNFNYESRGNGGPPRGNGGPSRRFRMPRATVQFAKELYLQANCQFVVKDGGDYAVQACDPDILVDWDLVEQVRIASVGPSACPICLNLPSAGKITRCGHVYCWPCILHYLSLGDNHRNRCPICHQEVQKKDLRSVKMLDKVEYKVGDVITLKLMKRERTSTYAVPISSWENRKGRPQSISDEQNTEYAKVLVASDAEIQTSVIEEERRALEALLLSAECSEECFIETALAELFEREISLQHNTQGFDHDSCNEDSGREERPSRAKTATVPTPAVSMPLLLSGSYGRTKKTKVYADAFDDLEEDEKKSIASCDLSEEENDNESTDGSISLSTTDGSVSLSSSYRDGSPVPWAHSALSSNDNQLSGPSDESLALLLPDLVKEAELTTEEAVEQLASPSTDVEQPSTDVEQPNTDIEQGSGSSSTCVDGSRPAATDGPVRNSKSKSRRGRGADKSGQFFYFYQATDGQPIYMHSVNAGCITYEYGGLEHGPQTITAKIIEKKITSMDMSHREHVRYLNHLPLRCEYQVVEVDLQPPIVSTKTLHHFSGALNRQKVKRAIRCRAEQMTIKKQEKHGIYPEFKLALDNPDQFPAPVSDGDERRLSSVSDPVLDASPHELNFIAAEFSPSAVADNCPPDNGLGFFSFADILKKSKQPVAQAAEGAGASLPLPIHVDSDGDTDDEDRVPVPLFKNSFSEAISSKLDTVLTHRRGGGVEFCEEIVQSVKQEGGQGGKKKKKKTQLLFSNNMMRR